MLSDLAQLALLGTERQAPETAAADSPLGALLAQLDASAREPFVLSAAALAVQHARVGALPACDSAPLPEPCRAEALRRASHEAGAHLSAILGGERAQFLPEWLALAAQTGQLAPPATLPALLSLGASKPDHRDAILPVLGETGRWLAAQNPAWTWPTGATDDEAIWQTGAPPARLQFLRRLRRANAARARELLASTWKQEAAEDRAAYLKTFEAALGPDDEPFLEAALDDKRKETRRAAVLLLALLPGSALVRRMTERVKPLLNFTPGQAGGLLKLKKTRKAVLEVAPPAQCDPAMLRDGIEPKPQAGIGEKAWWVVQMLQVAPLDTWTAEWRAGPAEILGASLEGEWKNELCLAWDQAAAAQRNAEWAEVLLDAPVKSRRLESLEALLAALPPVRREGRLVGMLEAGDAKTRDLQTWLVLRGDWAWSAGFSRAVLSWLHQTVAGQIADYQLRTQLPTLAARLAPETLLEATAGWPEKPEGGGFWAGAVDLLASAAQFRHDLRAALLLQG